MLEGNLTMLAAVFFAPGAFPSGRSGFLPFALTGESTLPQASEEEAPSNPSAEPLITEPELKFSALSGSGPGKYDRKQS